MWDSIVGFAKTAVKWILATAAVKWLKQGYRWRRLFATALIALAALTVMSRLDAVLQKMHSSKGHDVAGGVTSIAKPLVKKEDVAAVTRAWNDWDTENVRSNSDEAAIEYDDFNAHLVKHSVIAAWWLLVDSFVFAPALAYFLASLAWRRRRYFSADTEDKAIRQALKVTTILVIPAYFFTDAIVENSLTSWVAVWGHDNVVGILGFCSLAKVILIALAALVIVLSFLYRPEGAKQQRERLWSTLRVLRVPLVVSAFVAVVLTQLPANVRDQLDDVMRQWQTEHLHLFFAVAGAFAASLAVAITSRWLLAENADANTAPEAKPLRLIIIGVVGGAVAAVAWFGWKPGKPALFPLGVLLLIYAVLSWPDAIRTKTNERERCIPIRGVPCALSVLPAAALTLGWLHAEVGIGPRFGLIRALLIGIALTCGSWLFAELIHKSPAPAGQPPFPHAEALPWPAAAGLIVVGVVSLLAPHIGIDGYSARVGAVGLLMVFALGVLCVGVGADLWARPPRAMLATLRFERAPILLVALIVFVSASFIDDKPGFNKVTVRATKTNLPANPVELDTAINDWLDLCAPTRPTASGCRAAARPMFLIASSGGGARAAYWQIVVQDCLLGGTAPASARAAGTKTCAGAHLPSSVAFASGISGGSVGLAMEAADAIHGKPNDLDERALFKGGFLDRTFGNLLETDLPNSFAHYPKWRDRARALEENWIDRLPKMNLGFFATHAVGPKGNAHVKHFPVLMLNSASVEEGCRVNVSVINGSHIPPHVSCRATTNGSAVGPLVATRDISEYLCAGSRDISLATAALLSARFPFVSPSGAITSCGDPDALDPDLQADISTFLVDGGYVDSSGASTISDLLPVITKRVREYNNDANRTGPCVQPVVLQVDNGYSDVAHRSPPKRPKELLAPISGAGKASGGRAEAERQRLAELAQSPLTDVGCGSGFDHEARYLHFYPESHPGIEAPLGWALSDFSQRDLEHQLFSENNREMIKTFKAWFTAKPQN